MNLVEKHIETALQSYANGTYYDYLKAAKAKYIEETGGMDEDSHEYETRMNAFNDWYLFNFRRPDGRRAVDDYIEQNDLEEALAKSLYNVNYSVFQFIKINFRKDIVLKDVLHNEKFALKPEDYNLGLLEGDLFVGRLISIEKKNYLLKGVCTLPRDILSGLKKESKRVRKLNNHIEEEKFLLNLEKLKTKSLHYGHVSANQIFSFK